MKKIDDDDVTDGVFVALGIATVIAMVVAISYCTYVFITGVCK